MKLMFVEAKSDSEIKLNNQQIKQLPNKIGIVTTVQYVDQLDSITKQLKHKKPVPGRGKQKYKPQIIGCDVSAAENIKGKVNAFLYIGTGKFHPQEIALKTNKPVYLFNPINKDLTKIKEDEIKKIQKRKKGSLIKFLSSEKIGILISTKPGQNKLKQSLKLKNKFKDKEFFFLMFNTLNFNELENFPFIECFVNTACPRIYDDYDKFEKPVINLEDIK